MRPHLVAGTGTVSRYTAGDGYQYYVFTNTGTFTVSNTSLSNADILVGGRGGCCWTKSMVALAVELAMHILYWTEHKYHQYHLIMVLLVIMVEMD